MRPDKDYVKLHKNCRLLSPLAWKIENKNWEMFAKLHVTQSANRSFFSIN